VVAFTDAFALVDERAVFAALRAAGLVSAFFITQLRLTEFSGKGNPPVESESILLRVLVDGAPDRLIARRCGDRRLPDIVTP
jgi:hypothetical protein